MKIAIYGFGNIGKLMTRRLLEYKKYIPNLLIYVYDDMKETTELNLEYNVTFKGGIPESLNFFGNDQKQEFLSIYESSNPFNLIYICVPTDTRSDEDESCNTDIVWNVINEIRTNKKSQVNIIIKSTVPPSFADRLEQMVFVNDCFIKDHLFYSPEFSSKGPHGGSEDFMILGSFSGKNIPSELQDLILKSLPGSYKIYTCTWVEASVCKYFINTFLATKVLLCNEFAMLCHKYNANYNIVRNIVTEDKRVGPSHTFENESHSYKDSYCFMKDVKALAAESSEIMNLVCCVRDVNEGRIKTFDN